MARFRVYLLLSIVFVLSWRCANQANLANSSLGMQLYQKYCKACHGMDGSRGVAGAADLSNTNLSFSEVKEFIAVGSNRMMGFSEVLEASEIDSVASFVLTLLKPNME